MDEFLLQQHQDWLNLLQPVGLIASPPALLKAGAVLPTSSRERRLELREHCEQPDGRVETGDLRSFCIEFLGWHPAFVLAGAELPGSCALPLPEYGEVIRADFGLGDADLPERLQLLAMQVAPGTGLDDTLPDSFKGWPASPQARFERLLRAAAVPIGLLSNGGSVRLVYAPQGESSGFVTWKLADLLRPSADPMLGALWLLLSGESLLSLPEHQRLPAILRESRKYQNQVTQELAEQVLAACNGLLGGFQAAHEYSGGALLRDVAPADLYGGLLGSILRLIFLLYAEERGLLPQDPGFERSYSVLGLFARLREDESLHPDTMDQRFGAWAQLLALWRLVHDGARWQSQEGRELTMPARHGRLFDPDAWPFLEGRSGVRQLGAVVRPPRVPDGVVLHLLRSLLMLGGERLSYRALDVEQIGSVYESMMGFTVEVAAGPSLGLKPDHVVVNLQALLDAKSGERGKILKDLAKVELSGDAAAQLRAATTVEQLAQALQRRQSGRTPRIIAAGGRFLQPTPERRRSGAHYTPRQLTEPIVQTALRPLLADLGPHPTAAQLLALKVCDPAMGSGAFLVQVCRQLAEEVVAAWQFHGTTPLIPPDEEPLLHARRLVAQQCLYGVDKNPFAVDLAKLSIWLVTLARDHAFTFVDHALRCGDSLVGLSQAQIGAFSWESSRQIPIFQAQLAKRLGGALRLRQEVRSLGDADPLAVRLAWQMSEEELHQLRLLGNAVVAAFFDSVKPVERERRRQLNQEAAEQWLRGAGIAALTAAAESDGPVPFHWAIEFPEVFEGGGFDAVVGNPPFAGKNTLIAGSSAGYLDWLKVLHPGAHGNADLVAHFFRRGFDLLKVGGCFGLIATNTIGQGDTRATGLREICRGGGVIYAATRRVKWPGLAAVVVSVVHVRKGLGAGEVVLDGRVVPRISAFLFHQGGDEDPQVLTANAGTCFLGTNVVGEGFKFDDNNADKGSTWPTALAAALIEKDKRNAERIFPFLGGEEINDNPSHAAHRLIVDFGDASEAEARLWPDLFSLVEAKVFPSRQRENREAYRRFWWRHGERRIELYRAVKQVERVLVSSQTSKYRSVANVSARSVFSTKVVVWTGNVVGLFPMLQCRAHELWSTTFGSTLEDRPVYTPSDCFETYPFPPAWSENPDLESIGTTYYTHRANLMVANNQGLTATYNRFHDPEETDAGILRLRHLHDEMDRAVLDAYGWTDLQPTCAFLLDHDDEEDGDDPATPRRRKKPWRYRWPDEVRDEVLARLLALNAERAAEERLRGAAAEQAARKAAAKAQGALAKPKKAATDSGQGSLF